MTMSTTNRNVNTAFIIDTSCDRSYPLFMSDLPAARELLNEIPLSNINWDALEALTAPDSPTAEYEALLIPTDSARTISVVVDTHVVGTLPDSTLISHSQIARVYASGFIPTCTLTITPGESILARIFLFKTGGGVPFNDPPEKTWTLLPAGALWQVEPTRVSPFNDIPNGSQVLLELRASGDLISIYLNSSECGILDIDAADALSGAVQVAAERNHLTLAQGCVSRTADGCVSLHIDALPFNQWTRDDFALPPNPREKLVPYSNDPLSYLDGLKQFIRDHEAPRDLVRERRQVTRDWLTRISPVILILLGFGNLVIAAAIDDLSARGLVGVFGLSFVFIFLGAWLSFCQKRDTPRRKQPRHWNFLIPIGVSALIPSVVFANIGFFYDSQNPTSQTSSAGMTTLQNFPDFPTNRSLQRSPDHSVDSIIREPVTPMMDIWPEVISGSITASELEEILSPLPSTLERSPEPTRSAESDNNDAESDWTPPLWDLLPDKSITTTREPEDTPTSTTPPPEETPWHPDIIIPTDGIPIWGVLAPDDDPPTTEPEPTPVVEATEVVEEARRV